MAWSATGPSNLLPSSPDPPVPSGNVDGGGLRLQCQAIVLRAGQVGGKAAVAAHLLRAETKLDHLAVGELKRADVKPGCVLPRFAGVARTLSSHNDAAVVELEQAHVGAAGQNGLRLANPDLQASHVRLAALWQLNLAALRTRGFLDRLARGRRTSMARRRIPNCRAHVVTPVIGGAGSIVGGDDRTIPPLDTAGITAVAGQQVGDD